MTNVPINQIPSELPCKACGTYSPALGSIDFNRSRKEWINYAPSPSGKMVFYNQCPSCGLVFTSAFDNWKRHEFTKYIYNEFYKCIDGGAPEREIYNAKRIAELFEKSKKLLQILDFGGGSGGFSRALSKHGFQVDTFDPFVGINHSIKKNGYDLITSYEVLEHTTNPQSTINEISALVKEGGMIIFSTLVQPNDFEDRGLFWWYVSPRSGHVSIHTKESLKALWGSAGFHVASFDENTHIAYKDIPIFASHLFGIDKKNGSTFLITKRPITRRIKDRLRTLIKKLKV